MQASVHSATVSRWGPIAILALVLGSCATARIGEPPTTVPPKVSKTAPFNPQGGWKYEERGFAYVIDLDQQGRGEYAWKDGWVETVAIEGRKWIGTWHQAGNDREGGFELLLSEDCSQAEGRWWYSRIGDNHEPKRPGGTFRLTRVHSGQDRQVSPAEPRPTSAPSP